MPQSYIADHLPLQVWTAAPDGRLDYVNRFTADYFGVSPDRILKDGWQNMLHPSDLKAANAAWRESVETGKPYLVEFRIIRGKDQRYRWHRVHADALRDPQGAVTKWVGVNIDVDEEKRSLEVQDALVEQVKEERERVRAYFAQAPLALSTTSGPDHRIEQMNEFARRLLGGRNLEGRSLREALPELQGQGLIELMDQVYNTGETFVGTAMPVRYDPTGEGQLREAWFDVVYQPIRDRQLQITGLMSVSVDVTEQVAARRRSEELSAALGAIVSLTREGVMVADAHGRILFLNTAARSLLNSEETDVPPEKYAQVYGFRSAEGGTYPLTRFPLYRAIRMREGVDDEPVWVKSEEDELIPLVASARPIEGTGGEFLGAVLTLRRRQD